MYKYYKTVNKKKINIFSYIALIETRWKQLLLLFIPIDYHNFDGNEMYIIMWSLLFLTF